MSNKVPFVLYNAECILKNREELRCSNDMATPTTSTFASIYVLISKSELGIIPNNRKTKNTQPYITC